MNLRITVIAFSLVVISIGTQAQKQTQLPMPEVPLTPEAAAFAKYGNTPVNHSTGAVNLQIPIYDFNYKSFSIPLGLAYTGSGFKVDEMATEVGLGWTLQGKGMVSQSIRGLRDQFDGSSGYNSETEIFNLIDSDLLPAASGPGYYYCPENDCGSGQFLDNAKKPTNQDDIRFGDKDGEPDIFHFNYPGGSGKFYINKQGEPVTIESSRIKISLPSNPDNPGHPSNKFVITNEVGVVFTFAAHERTKTENSCDNGASWFDNIRLIENDYTSSYHLSSICLPEGGCINYEYVDYEKIYYNGLSQTEYAKVSPDGQPKGISTCFNKVSITEGKRLSRIYADNNTEVAFTYTGDALERVEIITDGEVTNYFDLNSAYINGYTQNISGIEGQYLAAAGSRLMLNSLQEKGKNPYKFKYASHPDYGSIILPSALTYARDHWGYFNGHIDNTSLIPSGVYIGYSMGDANRSPSATHMEASMLKDVTYPTGGTTHYTYEPHQRDVILEPDQAGCTQTIETSTGSWSSVGNQGPITYEFTIPEGAYDIWANYSSNVPYENTIQVDPVHGEPFSQCVILSQQAFTGNSFNQAIDLPPGTHQLRLWTNGVTGDLDQDGNPIPVSTSITISWKEVITTCPGTIEDQILTLVYGGVRLKTQSSYPRATTDPSEGIHKTYEYGDAITNNDIYIKVSGLYKIELGLYYFPTYVPYLEVGISPCSLDGGVEPYFGSSGTHYIKYNSVGSQSRNPLGFSNGATMYYGIVSEIDGLLPEGFIEENPPGSDFENPTINGKREFVFSNSNNERRGLNFIYSEDDYSHLNGTLKAERLYSYNENSGYQIVHEKRYHYSFHNTKFGLNNTNYGDIWALKAVVSHPSFRKVESGQFEDEDIIDGEEIVGNSACKGVVPRYKNTFYKVFSIWKTLDFVEEIDHERNMSIRSTHSYSDTYLHLLKTNKQNNSYSEVQRFVYSTSMGSSHSFLVTKNIISQPIWAVTEYNGILISVLRNNFENDNGRVRLTRVDIAQLDEFIPSGLMSLETIINDKGRSQYFRYNEFGNVIEHERDDEFNAYIWMSNNRELVATIENARASEVFYESFENNGTQGQSKTGAKYLSSGSYNISNPPSGSNLKMSYWYWSGGKWNYSGELDFSPTINSSGSRLDEIRVYPEHGRMTTYTYESGIGISSITDPNGVTQYFSYDAANRLSKVSDNDRNLLQHTEYKYQTQN